MFCKKGVLGNFAKLTGKHLCQIFFLIKLQALVCNFIKKETVTQVFSCDVYEISKDAFSYRTPPVVAYKFKRRCWCVDGGLTWGRGGRERGGGGERES